MRTMLRWSVLVLAAGCGTYISSQTSTICSSTGSNPPTDCAVVYGVAHDIQGKSLSLLRIQVDSSSGGQLVYSSVAQTTGTDGSFIMVVSRHRRVQAPASPDTASVEIKSFSPTGALLGRAVVPMAFVPLGDPVVPTTLFVVFDHPSAP